MNLTRLDWIKDALGIEPTNTDSDAALSRLIADASEIIADELGRRFGNTEVREWLDGNGECEISLAHTPVHSIKLVRCGRAPALSFSRPSAPGLATWRSDGAGLTLEGSGGSTRILWSDAETVADLVAAIDTAGWTATAKAPADTPTRIIAPARGEADGTLYYAPDPIDADLPPDSERYLRACDGSFPKGCGNVFVWYDAGWTLPVEGEPEPWSHTLPAGLISVVNEIVIEIWKTSQATKAGFAAGSSVNSLDVFCKAVRIDDYQETYDLKTAESFAATASRGVAGLIEERRSLLEQWRLVAFDAPGECSGSVCVGDCILGGS